MIVLDTSALSMVFRRVSADEQLHPIAQTFRRLVDDDEDLRVPGVVVQELLSGVRTDAAFTRLEAALSGFQVLLATENTHRLAAQVRNRCRAAGIAAASFDCLICAHTLEHAAALLTLDRDVDPMVSIVGLRLHA